MQISVVEHAPPRAPGASGRALVVAELYQFV
jgi:hypothetical protein